MDVLSMKPIIKDLQPFIFSLKREDLVREINEYTSIALRTDNNHMKKFAEAKIQIDRELLREKYGVDYRMYL